MWLGRRVRAWMQRRAEILTFCSGERVWTALFPDHHEDKSVSQRLICWNGRMNGVPWQGWWLERAGGWKEPPAVRWEQVEVPGAVAEGRREWRAAPPHRDRTALLEVVAATEQRQQYTQNVSHGNFLTTKSNCNSSCRICYVTSIRTGIMSNVIEQIEWSTHSRKLCELHLSGQIIHDVWQGLQKHRPLLWEKHTGRNIIKRRILK